MIRYLLRAALIAICSFGATYPSHGQDSPPIEELLTTYDQGATPARVLAVYKAARLENEAGHSLVQRALKDSDAAVRARAFREWIRSHQERVLPSLSDQLQSSPARVRRQFYVSAAEFVGDSAIPYLLEGLMDSSVGVRKATIRHLQRLSGGMNLGYDASTDPETDQKAVDRWRTWWDENKDLEPWQRWISATRDSRSANRARAVSQLSRAPAHAAVPALLQRLEDSSPRVRDQAVRVLRDLTLTRQRFDADATLKLREEGVQRWRTWWSLHAGNTVRSWMETALQSDSAKERGRAALSLGRGGDPSAIPNLLPLLEDSSSRVRQRSHRALIQLTGRDHQFDPDASPEQRRKSLARWNAWWEKLQDRPPREWWHDAIRTGTPKERARAARRLAESDAQESVPWIVEALRDPSGGVRESAYYALQELLGQDFAFDPDAPPLQRERSIQKVLRRWSRQR